VCLGSYETKHAAIEIDHLSDCEEVTKHCCDIIVPLII
jgi:hypothetical protein